MESRTAQENLNLLISSLDTILIGASVPFAVETILTSKTPEVAAIIGSAYFLSLINFFHAKFNLILIKEFDEFTGEAPQFLNFLNITLHIVLIGSFVFMAFFLDQPIEFIIVNLVMRVCDLIMDIGVLVTVDQLNISRKTQADLRHLHTSWFVGTSVFIGFHSVSIYLVSTQHWTNMNFAFGFLVLEIIDVITDYYNNRRFYFGTIPLARVKLLLNKKSRQFIQASKLIALLNEDLRQGAQKWLQEAVEASELSYAWEKVWYVEEDSEIEGYLGTRILPWSKTLFVKYLIVRNPKTWLKDARLLFETALSARSQAEGARELSREVPPGIVVDLSQLQSQVFPDLRADLSTFLRQIGFQPLDFEGKEKRYLYMTGPGLPMEIPPDLQKLILSALDYVG